jgi:MATE family multidrug resistance protein
MNAGGAITHRRVFAIAGPAMLANLTTPLLGIVSTAAIGRLGDEQWLGGVALASVAFDCIFWLFGFLRMATVAFTAQALGAGDALERHAIVLRALLLGLVIGLGLIALQVPLAAVIFSLMGGSEAVTQAAREYFFIRLYSAPLLLANYALVGWFVGQARTGIALALQVTINVVNMALTALLVLGLGYGIAGAAFAAVVAELVGLCAGLFAMGRLLDGRLALPRGVLLDRVKLLRLFAVNRDILLRTAALIGGFLFFTAQGARSGDLTLAANAVLYNFLMIGSFFLDGLATAAEQLCGLAFGARARAPFSRAVRLVLGWSVAFGIAISALFLIGGGALIDLITTSTDVRAAARGDLVLAALAPLCGVLAYAFDGIFVGASWTRDMRNLMIAAFAIYLATFAALSGLGNHGLWLAFLTFLLARGLLQAARYPALVRSSFAFAQERDVTSRRAKGSRS